MESIELVIKSTESIHNPTRRVPSTCYLRLRAGRLLLYPALPLARLLLAPILLQALYAAGTAGAARSAALRQRDMAILAPTWRARPYDSAHAGGCIERQREFVMGRDEAAV